MGLEGSVPALGVIDGGARRSPAFAHVTGLNMSI